MQNVAATVVMASGVLGVHETKEIARTVATLMEQGQLNLVVDWSAVEWINPLAIGLLLARYQPLINRGGALKFSAMKPTVSRLFSNYGVADLIESYASVEDALESFGDEWRSRSEGQAM